MPQDALDSLRIERTPVAAAGRRHSKRWIIIGLIVLALGAIIGAMITMYGAVASRTAEIGTLRAIGFSRFNILIAFLGESLLLSLLGGLAGLGAASFMQLVSISTMNWQTFAELAFAFHLTPGITAGSLGFSLFMGFLGGVLPAWRAARLNIVAAIRSA